MTGKKIGVWMIGALGSISTTVMLGALARRQGRIDSTGMVTETEPFRELGLVPVEALTFGGCDIRSDRLFDAVQARAREVGGVAPSIAQDCKEHLWEIQESISAGLVRNCGEAIRCLADECTDTGRSVREEIAEVMACIARFKLGNDLDEVVVVNLASTEPPLGLTPCHEDLAALEECLDGNHHTHVRASTIYAYAAIRSGHPYINFTPSNGALFPAMVKLAETEQVPVMGNDGKTGETLVKSALAPMFACRNLSVLSWEGFNILGNMDGRVLENPENKESKIKTKDAVLGRILGYQPHSGVSIGYVPSLSDQKIAWDFIHFRGFLGSTMSLQFVWQGFDSLLAAPLVLDLVRLAEFAGRRGEAGLMPQLACYFKSPIGVREYALYDQFKMLTDYVAQVLPNRE